MAGEKTNKSNETSSKATKVDILKEKVRKAQQSVHDSQQNTKKDIEELSAKLKEDLKVCLDKITKNLQESYEVDYTRTCWWELWADASFIKSSQLGISDPDYQMIINMAKLLATAVAQGTIHVLEVAAEKHLDDMNPYIILSRAVVNMSILSGVAFGFYIKSIISIAIVASTIFKETVWAKTKLKLLVRKRASGNSRCEKCLTKGYGNLLGAKEKIPEEVEKYLNEQATLQMDEITVNNSLTGDVSMDYVNEEYDNLLDSMDELSEKTALANDSISIASGLIPEIVAEMSGIIPGINYMVSAHYHHTTRDVITSYFSLQSGILAAQDRYAKMIATCMDDLGKSPAAKTIAIRASECEITPDDLAKLFPKNFSSSDEKIQRMTLEYKDAEYNSYLRTHPNQEDQALAYAEEKYTELNKAISVAMCTNSKKDRDKLLEDLVAGKIGLVIEESLIDSQAWGSNRSGGTDDAKQFNQDSTAAPSIDPNDYQAISDSIEESKTEQISDEEREEAKQRIGDANIKANELSKRSVNSLINLPSVNIKALVEDKLKAILEAFQGIQFFQPLQGFLILDDLVQRVLVILYKSYRCMNDLFEGYYEDTKAIYSTFYMKTNGKYIIKMINRAFNPDAKQIDVPAGNFSDLEDWFEFAGEVQQFAAEVIAYVGDIISQVMELIAELPAKIIEIIATFITNLIKSILTFIQQLMSLILHLIFLPSIAGKIGALSTKFQNPIQTTVHWKPNVGRYEETAVDMTTSQMIDAMSGVMVGDTRLFGIDPNEQPLNEDEAKVGAGIDVCDGTEMKVAFTLMRPLLKLLKDNFDSGDSDENKFLKQQMKDMMEAIKNLVKKDEPFNFVDMITAQREKKD